MRDFDGHQGVRLRPATVDDWIAFYGSPPKHSFKGLAAEMDGQTVGLTGLQFQRPYVQAFGNMSDPLRPFKDKIGWAVRWMIRQMTSHGRPVIAVASPREPTAPAMLTRMGFSHVGSSPDGEVYQWKPSYR